MHGAFKAALWPLLFALIACSSLPDYATPKGQTVDPSSVNKDGFIGYRQLKRSDFLANHPPGNASAHAKELGAMTCSYLITSPDTSFQIQEIKKSDSSTFTATVETLGFGAYMDRECSWWNPQEGTKNEAYLLQHEQTHFALTELAARKLNARVPEFKKTMSAEAETMDAAKEALEAELHEIIKDAQEELVAVNLEFDEDTSGKHAPEEQQKWADKINAELEHYAP